MKMSCQTIALLLLITFQGNAFSFSSAGGWRGRGGRFVGVEQHPHENVSGHRYYNHIRPMQRLMAPPLPAVASPSSSSSKSSLESPPALVVDAVLNFYSNLDRLYDKSIRIKCPFFRRRAADLIDNAATVVQFLLIRHKSLPGISDLFLNDLSPVSMAATTAATSAMIDEKEDQGFSTDNIMSSHHNLMDVVSSPPGCKPLGYHIKRHPDGTSQKERHLSTSDIAHQIQMDWTGGTNGQDKGYYITGKLDSTIYKDDCLFTGPDPDMPVRGLRKYLNAASHLFDPKLSDAALLSLSYDETGGNKGHGVIEVTWRLGGVIQLPWHPTVEPWTGKTIYHLNEEHLIYLHEETWDISVWRAFLVTLFPDAKNWKIWKDGEGAAGN
ncbi:hypothetical protein ACHAWU_005166 [Discostella pseudostelligera]|uniref:Uncharacterized protein n=1 Tax=Discostella pseudostelligera TaxID=259834 RepID=A0ABD3N9M5_9STRA